MCTWLGMHGAIMCREVIFYVGLPHPPLSLSLSLIRQELKAHLPKHDFITSNLKEIHSLSLNQMNAVATLGPEVAKMQFIGVGFV